MRNMFAVLSLLVLLSLTAAQNSESPVSGGFTSDAAVGGDYDYKAGEFSIQAEGALPPAQEQLEITSLGRKDEWNSIGSIEGFDGEATYEDQDRYGNSLLARDNYYAWSPGVPGLYDVRTNVSLEGGFHTYQRYYGEGYALEEVNYSAKVEIYKDEELVCNSPFYTDTIGGSDYGDKTRYSDACGVYGTVNSYLVEQFPLKYSQVYRKRSQDTGLDRAKASYYNYDPREQYDDIGEDTAQEIFSFSRKHSSKKNFSAQKRVRIRNQKVEPKNDDRKDDTIVESFQVKVREKDKFTEKWYGDVLSQGFRGDGNVEIRDFEIRYIDPVANAVVQVNVDNFTSNVATIGDYQKVLRDSGWRDTSRSIDVDINGIIPDRSFDDTKTIMVEGEFKATSPPGVTPEEYRIVRSDDPSQVLVKFDSLDSSTTSDYVRKEVSLDLRNEEVDLTSGEYKLQVKSTANNYPVQVGIRNLKVKPDSYIRVGETDTFQPDLDLGQNKVTAFTSNANNLNYTYTWSECTAGELERQPYPTANDDITTPSPELSINPSCSGARNIDSVEFVNAATGEVMKSRTNAPGDGTYTAQTDLGLGEQYQWFVRFCDQDKCHTTDAYQFTVGGSGTADGGASSELDVSGATEGLDREIRDEDFNALGQDTRTSTPLSQGYINKIEDDSDQLETGAKWKNSDGSKENADQYAITPTPEWTVDNRGNIYPPPTDPQYRSTFYRTTSNRRSGISDPSIPKSSKVFGNSLGVVAAEDITGSGGELVARKGTGVWIDPDQIRKTQNGGEYDYAGDWKELLTFNIDITGPDSGLGYDDNDNDPTDYKNNRKVAITDIYWQRQS